jgi:hypothetical protein
MVCQVVCFGGFLLLLRRIINAKQAEYAAKADAAFRKWFVAEEEGKPSKAALILDAAGAVVGSAAARSIMASLNTDKGHAARAANGIADEMIAQQNPLLGILTGSKRGKGAAVQRLAEMIGPMLSNMGKGGNGDSAPPARRHHE